MENLNLNYCPNCWGYQEYQGFDCKPLLKRIIKIGWIDAYFRKYLAKE